jgi:hypothetical protein
MTDDYLFRKRAGGVRNLIMESDRTISQWVPMRKRSLEYSTIINVQDQELTNYLTEKRKGFDLSKPEVKLERVDNIDLMEKIKNMSYAEWVKKGGNQVTRHYMKKKISEDGQYKIYRKDPILSR